MMLVRAYIRDISVLSNGNKLPSGRHPASHCGRLGAVFVDSLDELRDVSSTK